MYLDKILLGYYELFTRTAKEYSMPQDLWFFPVLFLSFLSFIYNSTEDRPGLSSMP